MIEPVAITSAIMCLAMNVHFESRGEPLAGQRAVAHVTLNRAREQHARICDVVFEPGQFSWTIHDPRVRDEAAWARSLAVARRAFYAGRAGDPTGGATFYHATYVSPRWAAGMTRTASIGRHLFYTPGTTQVAGITATRKPS